jgi:hypothetical protein
MTDIVNVLSTEQNVYYKGEDNFQIIYIICVRMIVGEMKYFEEIAGFEYI